MNHPASHRYFLENTAPAIAEAFKYGATRVSINLQATKDGKVVLFHDSQLACRTNGTGSVEEKSSEELRSLNVGWQYTPDGGDTFPWRDPQTVDRTFTLMPFLEEVIDSNPEKGFWIVVRPGSREALGTIISQLKKYPAVVKNSYLFYPPKMPWVRAMIRTSLPELKLPRIDFGKNALCLRRFEASESLPAQCSDLDVLISIEDVTRLGKAAVEFSGQLKALNPPSALYIGSEYGGLVDDLDSATFVKKHQDAFAGFMTDRIEMMGPLFAPAP